MGSILINRIGECEKVQVGYLSFELQKIPVTVIVIESALSKCTVGED